MQAEDEALVLLGRWLREQGYRFITPTPETVRRVSEREVDRPARTIREVFGWSAPFRSELLPQPALELLRRSGQLQERGGALRSRVRFSSLGDQLFVHSAYPTTEADAVFFGPDTYRYARMLGTLPGRFRRAIDIGAGSGAGLMSIAGRCDEVVLADVNSQALRFAGVNAALNGVRCKLVRSDVLAGVEGTFDLIVSNPPYLVDDDARAYRHGGERGIELPVRIVKEALGSLAPGGTLAVYTGTPIVEGRDLFFEAVRPLLAGFEVLYEEIDPDVFSEELERPAYADVERIAVSSLRATRARS